MSLPRPSPPSVLIADLRAFLAERSRHQIVAAILALFMPIAIVTGFLIDSSKDDRPPPQIIYVKSWRADRSDAEIIADQKKALAEREAQQKEKQRQWQKLDENLNRLGI